MKLCFVKLIIKINKNFCSIAAHGTSCWLITEQINFKISHFIIELVQNSNDIFFIR